MILLVFRCFIAANIINNHIPQTFFFVFFSNFFLSLTICKHIEPASAVIHVTFFTHVASHGVIF